MREQLKQYYAKEEEFLDRFETAALIAARSLKGAWSPEYRCDDTIRRNRASLLASRELHYLTFAGAAVYHDDAGFSSVQIVLRSATRSVNVRVRKVDQRFVAETLADKLLPPDPPPS